MANPFCHVELTTPDLAKSKKFYGELFNWNLEDVPMGEDTYTLIKPGEGTGGGMMQMQGMGSFWLSYVLVDDVKAATAKAKSLGATAMKENVEVMGAGWFSILTDPTGATFALWQAKAA